MSEIYPVNNGMGISKNKTMNKREWDAKILNQFPFIQSTTSPFLSENLPQSLELGVSSNVLVLCSDQIPLAKNHKIGCRIG